MDVVRGVIATVIVAFFILIICYKISDREERIFVRECVEKMFFVVAVVVGGIILV